jgi:hypothetical protein
MGEEEILNGVMGAAMPAEGEELPPEQEEPRADPGALLDEVMTKLAELRGLVAPPQ